MDAMLGKIHFMTSTGKVSFEKSKTRHAGSVLSSEQEEDLQSYRHSISLLVCLPTQGCLFRESQGIGHEGDHEAEDDEKEQENSSSSSASSFSVLCLEAWVICLDNVAPLLSTATHHSCFSLSILLVPVLIETLKMFNLCFFSLSFSWRVR